MTITRLFLVRLFISRKAELRSSNILEFVADALDDCIAYVRAVRPEELRHLALLNVALDVVCSRSPSPSGDVPGVDAQKLRNNRGSSRLQVEEARGPGVRVIQYQLVSSNPVRDSRTGWGELVFITA